MGYQPFAEQLQTKHSHLYTYIRIYYIPTEGKQNEQLTEEAIKRSTNAFWRCETRLFEAWMEKNIQTTYRYTHTHTHTHILTHTNPKKWCYFKHNKLTYSCCVIIVNTHNPAIMFECIFEAFEGKKSVHTTLLVSDQHGMTVA